MRRLAAFIMRGPVQATLVIVVASLLPLFGWFGATVIALVTLRGGVRGGVTVMAAAGASLLLIHTLLTGAPQVGLLPLLELWLPAFLLAVWLRRTVSLAATLRLAAVLAGLGVAWMYLLYPDQAVLWAPLLEQVGRTADAGAEQVDAAWLAFIEGMLPLMTGILVLSLAVAVVAAVLLARWLQALLYYPGGFRREFHDLNLGRPMAAVVTGLLLVALASGDGLAHDLAFVVSAVFVLQALSLGHALMAKRGSSRGWFIGIYALLPLLFQLVVVIGIADAAFGWRRRFLAGSGDGNAV
ncbi:MAG TPA: hypothetical protein VFY81_14040 [Gammaproteobacteria bacterium]|nr:hypothetical protein [Gammaproteobacteria bacterium]